jgi:N-acetylneuraminic acid mutarotase
MYDSLASASSDLAHLIHTGATAGQMDRSHFACVAAVLLLGLAAGTLGSTARAQTNEWTWMGGSNTSGSVGPTTPGVYGTLGTPAAANIPGIRWGASNWTDSSGFFWLFGGHGVDANGNFGYLNDLWNFNPSTSEWTWMSGSSMIVPPGESEQDCVDFDCGQPGVYGTLGTPAVANVPGGRAIAANWMDNGGNLWLFGGYGFGAAGTGPDGELNDLWMYNPTTNEWTWMGGNTSDGNNSAIAIPGVYGTLGTPAAGNLPGGRDSASSSTDSNGNFWLFGGNGYDSTGACGILNDLWEFSPSSREWTWMSGSKTAPVDCTGQPGVYGTLGTAAAGNVPGGREGAASWIDESGNFWLFGGFAVPSDGYGNYLNDLWKFDPSSMEWAWMSGSSTFDPNCPPLDANGTMIPCQYTFGQPGLFGSLGTSSSGSVPSSRWAAASWIDNSGDFWLLGGQGVDANYHPGYLNDFWELNIFVSPVQWTWMGGSSTIPASCAGQEVVEGDTYLGILTCGQPGTYGSLGTPNASNIPGGRDTASFWTDKSGDLWLFGAVGFDSSGNFGALNDLWVFQSTVGTLPAITPAFSPGTGIYAAGQTVQISDATPSATIYYTTDGSTPSTSSLVYSGPITISSTETLKAMATANHYASSAPAAAAFTIAARTDTPTFNVPGGTYSTVQVVTISDLGTGPTIYYTTDGSTPSASSPVYTSAITLSSTTTINAVAVAPSLAMSAVATATYNIPPNFSIAVSPTVVTVAPGGIGGTTILTVTPWGGMNSAISFACSGLPPNATCSFSPKTVTPSASAATTQLTIAVGAQAGVTRPNSWPGLPVTGLAIAACLLVWRPRRQLGGALVILLLVVAGVLSGCGGTAGGGGGGGSPQSYTVTVAATSGTLQQTTAVTLTEN